MTLTLTLNIPNTVLQDFAVHWISQTQGQQMSLAAPVGAGDSQIVLTAAVTIAAGAAILVDGEPMTVSSAVTASATVPVTRGGFTGFTAIAHLQSVPVYQLTYVSYQDKIARECLTGYLQGIIAAMVARGQSATLPPLLTGSSGVTLQ